MALDDDMTSPPEKPYSEAPTSADELLDSGNSGGSGVDGGTDGGARTGDGAGTDDPTTDADEDSRFA